MRGFFIHFGFPLHWLKWSDTFIVPKLKKWSIKRLKNQTKRII